MAAIASALPHAAAHAAKEAAAASNAAKGAAASSGASSSDKSSSPDSSVANDSLANEQTFLQLLVAQLKNQDPTNPMDGTQFVTQLAQFSQLEQQLAMRKDLDTISGAMTATSPTGASGDGSNGSGK